MKKKQNKYDYIKVIQTNCGYGWEDSTAAKTLKEAKGFLKDYRLNQPQYSHRIISRRELNV